MGKRKYDRLIGIFMPAYNQGSYIDEAIKSLKEQTCQDFIVHIVDDGSNDGVTPEILNSIKYEKAKVFRNRTNKGVAFRARQHYRKFNTKYILVLCADDKLSPTFLEKTVAYMEKNKKCGAVSTNIIMFYDDPKIPTSVCEFDMKRMTINHIIGQNHMLGSSLMRRQALMEADLSGGFTRYQDWDRWISMLEAGWKMGLISEPLFYYRQHQKSLSHSASVEQELDIRRKLLKKHKQSYSTYYEQAILDISRTLLELQDGKNWLEGQYYSLTKEVDRLNHVIDDMKRQPSVFSLFKKIRLKISNTINKKKK